MIPENPGPYTKKLTEQQIPQELRSRTQWMGTRFAPRKDGKTDKPPYRVVPGKRITKADKNNAANWTSYEDALAAMQAGKVDAIGFVLSEGDPFWVADCDDVVDPDTGEVVPAAADFIHAQNSYAELSCSRKGVHVVGKGRKPNHVTRCKSTALGFGLEVYDRKRFVVITGNQIGATAEVADCQQELDALCRKLWPTSGARRPRQGRGGKGKGSATFINEDARHTSVADEDLLDRARRAKTGPKFCALYDHGDISRYDSPSEADYGLLNMLIFWCAGDPEQIARLFRGSALYREGKDKGYVDLSVSNALASYVGPIYRPRDVEQARQEEPEDPLAPYLALLLDPSAFVGRKAASLYKAYAGLVIQAAEDGIIDDQGNLRISTDLRRAAEVAGTRAATLSKSALPGLMQDMKLLRWRPGKSNQSGSFVLPKPEGRKERNNKVTTHLYCYELCAPEELLEMLRLVIRMRAGHSKHAELLRLGMPAMFTVVAFLAGGVRRGQKITELAARTGRRVRDLRKVLARLKGAGIAREVAKDTYRLTDDYVAQYERVLGQSGITYIEQEQKRRHADDRRRRDAALGIDKQDRPLKGKDHNAEVLKQRSEEDRQRRLDEQRQKVGTTAVTFLADELDGVAAMSVRSMKQRWVERGGDPKALWYAIQNGPFRKYREADGTLCVKREEAS